MTDECIHGLTPDTCTPCKRGVDVAGWGKPGRRRPFFGRASSKPGMVRASRLPAGSGADRRVYERGQAPAWQDNKFAVRGRTKADYPRPRPFPNR